MTDEQTQESDLFSPQSMTESPNLNSESTTSLSQQASALLQQNMNFNPNASTTVKLKKTVSKTKAAIQPINQVFADEDEDQNLSAPNKKRAKLTAMQLEQEKKRQQQQATTSVSATASTTPTLNAEERKKAVKKLVESIPTDRDELFDFKIDWSQMDVPLMEKRIKPWINRKIIEYIGEEEATLNDFLCIKIQEKTRPDKILDDVKVILDDEAELFVKKMWRLIVYETESKRLGLSK
jgi:RNA-binding protein 25